MTVEHSDASAGTEGRQVARPPRYAPALAIDATGLMFWPPGKGLAGIPRVESFLVNAALADPDPDVEVVVFRPGEGRFRPLAPFEQDHVAAGEISPHRVKRWPGRRMALSQAFEAVRQQPWDKRDADRHLARTVTNGGMGIAWQATRLLIRAYRLYQRARIRLGLREDAPARPVETEPGLVLISHHILTQEDRSAVSGGAGKLAFLCHDIIPALRPDLLGSSAGERRFGSDLEQLVRAGAPAFCASDEVGATLTEYMRKAGIGAPVVCRFPMPSILHETASRMGSTSRIEAGEPFVFYCSLGLRPPPCSDLLVIAGDQHFGNRASLELLRPCVVRMFEQAVLETFFLARHCIAHHAGQQPHHSVEQNERRRLAAGEDEITDRNFL